MTISGEAQSGKILTAAVSDDNGVPNDVQYQWFANGVAIAGAREQTYQVQWTDVGKTLTVQAEYRDNDTHAEKIQSPATAAVTYGIHRHSEYGDYVDAREFGADPTGQTDSAAAFQAALQAAQAHKVALFFGEGEFYMSKQIALNAATQDVTALFGAGMGKTQLRFDWAQAGVFNFNTNKTDTTDHAGILLDGQNGKILGDFSLKYTGEYYREAQTYFGKINAIQLNDTENSTIQRVDVSGANRAGIAYTSTSAVNKGLMDNLAAGRIKVEDIVVNSGNKVIDSHLHENRVAGVLVAFQQDFEAYGNTLARNGHKDDGGTGYGLSLMAGSYNNRAHIHHNTTDHNYRKGIDVHDGNNVTITHNTLNGDRLYGIAFEVRNAPLRGVTVENNTITMDPDFHPFIDDDVPPGAHRENLLGYSHYWGIYIETNSQGKNIPSEQPAVFTVANNTVQGLQDNTKGTVSAIQFRYGEKDTVPYTLNIRDNIILGKAADYLIDAKSNSLAPGDITIQNNRMEVDTITAGVPIYLEEKGSTLSNGASTELAGSIRLINNSLTVQTSGGWSDILQFVNNRAKAYDISGNTFNVNGVNSPLMDIILRAPGLTGSADVHVHNNTLTSDTDIRRDWLQTVGNAATSIDNNTYNGENITLPPRKFAARLLAEPQIQHENADSAFADNADLWLAEEANIDTDAVLHMPTPADTANADSLPSLAAEASTAQPLPALDGLLDIHAEYHLENSMDNGTLAEALAPHYHAEFGQAAPKDDEPSVYMVL